MCSSRRSGFPRHRKIAALIASRRAAASPRFLATSPASPATPRESATRSRIYCGHVVGGGIELGPEPVRGLDLVQEKIANLTLGNRPRNLILDVLANIGDLLMGNSNAPSIALRKLSYPGLLTAAHQCHISRRKVDGSAALGGSHRAT